MQRFSISLLTALAALFFFALSGAALAGISNGPYLLDLNKRGVTVVWETLDSSATIDYGMEPDNLDMTVEVSGNDGGMLRGKIECLRPNTMYYYQVSSGMAQSDVLWFFTGVEPDEPFFFIAYGDTRTNKEDHQLVIDGIIDEQPDFILHSGDLVDIAIFVWEWSDFFDVVLDAIQWTPFAPIMGNHEFWGGQPFFRKYFDTPDHSGTESSMFAFQYGNSYFINIDIAQFFIPGSAQYAWVEEQLELAANVPSVKHCIVQAHFPPYSASNHGQDLDVVSFRDSMTPLFEAYGVDLVFGGHDHNYQHSYVNDIHYIVTGGGGAPLYGIDPEAWTVAYEKSLNYVRVDVEDDRLTITGKRPDGTVIEQFEVVQDYGGAGTGDELPILCPDGDWDEDGLTDGEEYQKIYGDCTDPYNWDSDGDEWSDGDEVNEGTDPCDPDSYPGATDDDVVDDDVVDDDVVDDDVVDDDVVDDDVVDDDAVDDDVVDDDVADDDVADDDVVDDDATDDDVTDDDVADDDDDDDNDDGCGC